MFLEILTPTEKLFEGEIYLVKVPGTKGSFEVLKKHAPIISSLEAGKIKVITSEGKEEFFDIKTGFIEVKNDNINIVATV